ncbi:hypothetical protein SAMN05421858_4894 [Haladaptatus litoreus]|uniref:DUF5518 domain-containing protein n=1 Tax=Haladaptatus litoreus TaxID=553468 RepID=A0A1N7FB14_9EURY|nr:DUF5518 domain-containing protein [Haladaptatus litoreus]SIR97509.1 hypothetical protein SAMN05421858_4894 [Haladaptatus litoreus]
MEINWRAISAGFLIDFILALLITWFIPPALISSPLKVIPGLVGGLIAGSMVVGAYRGAINGGVAALFVGIILLVSWIIYGLFAEFVVGQVVLEFGQSVWGFTVLMIQAISGGVGGSISGWIKGRRTTPREAPEAEIQ